MSTEPPWARQASTGPLGECPAPCGSARKAIVFQRGVWALRGTKGCPSQNSGSRCPTPNPNRRAVFLGRLHQPVPSGKFSGTMTLPWKAFPQVSSPSVTQQQNPSSCSKLPALFPRFPRAQPVLLHSGKPRTQGNYFRQEETDATLSSQKEHAHTHTLSYLRERAPDRPRVCAHRVHA